MPTPQYQSGIPTGKVPLLSDYQNLQNNFTAADNSFGVDHTKFSNATLQNGYHTSIHMIPQGSITNTPGFGQLYSNTVNDVTVDQALFWNTGAGNLTIQLTSNLVPKLQNNGYTFFPGNSANGALIYQWGVVSATTGNATVTFLASGNINFPTAPLNIQVTAGRGPGSYTTNFAVSNVLTTGFVINNSNASTTSLSYYWTALGY